MERNEQATPSDGEGRSSSQHEREVLHRRTRGALAEIVETGDEQGMAVPRVDAQFQEIRVV